ncbi:DUF4232 domain-containing protein [Zafaria sp. Z1313]|uniref:DUF4232 domain-containing protein n=1 Tax=unclassified Zafaria TaxID=2828765 RepID=UPI002E783BBE|nr:DUF4232 domain-containing protein [Zafaria sp. J156]MEE1622686.1 DUF4232 domain-containing protein [Zafaria sp. J156]
MKNRTPILLAAALLAPLALSACGAPQQATESTLSPGSPQATSTQEAPASSSGPAGAAPTGAGTATPGTAPAGLPCSADDAEIVVEDVEGGADAQAVTRRLVVTNEGDECTLAGFPVITYQAAEGETLGAPAAHVGEPAPEITLGTGESAAAVLREKQAGKFDPEDCRPVDAPLLAVALSDGGATSYLKRDATACSSATVVLLEAGPYEK